MHGREPIHQRKLAAVHHSSCRQGRFMAAMRTPPAFGCLVPIVFLAAALGTYDTFLFANCLEVFFTGILAVKPFAEIYQFHFDYILVANLQKNNDRRFYICDICEKSFILLLSNYSDAGRRASNQWSILHLSISSSLSEGICSAFSIKLITYGLFFSISSAFTTRICCGE